MSHRTYLTGPDREIAERFMHEALIEARRSTCGRRFCGSVIVAANGEIIGRGFNSPPADDESQRRCHRKHEIHPTFKSDKTCCPHAEWRAIFDALRHYPNEIIDATLYFTSRDDNGEMLFSGNPYCTGCSKMALDVGLKYFVLWHEEGIVAYDTRLYNDLSYAWSADLEKPS